MTSLQPCEISKPSDSSSLDEKVDTPDWNNASSHEYEVDRATLRSIIRRMDIRILPVMSLLYLFSFLDRTAIGNAAIAGLRRDLGLTSIQYTVCLVTFFILYGLLEVPSNLMLKQFGAKIWIPIIMTAWGIIMLCTGFVQDFQGLLACRILLGAFEAGLFPGVTYYLTCWYCRHESQLRIGIFFSAATVAGAFGGLIAFGIAKIETGSFENWRWIFVIEGALTIAMAALAYYMIIDNPQTAKFLTVEEKKIVEQRVKYDGSAVAMDDSFDWKYVKSGILDLKVWLNFFIYVGTLGPVYSNALFMPTIINQMGYTVVRAQLLTVPVYTVAAIFVVALAFASDHYRIRSPFIILGMGLSMVGYGILYTSKTAGIRYFATYLSASGAYAAFPSVVCILTNNIAGKTKRSVAIGIQVGIGGMAGMISSSIFPSKDAPHFTPGILINLGLIGMALVSTVVMAIYLYFGNQKKQQRIDSGEAANLTQEELSQLGDSSPYFRYTY